jgi:NADPH:quinone reductase-like Zn-dependent oxidoreductase
VKAFVANSYGPPDVLQLTDRDIPTPAAGEVLVRVRATSINPYDWHLMRGEPRIARLLMGGAWLRRPKWPVPGCDMAGRVAAVGAGVSRFQAGDDVYALLPAGGFAEYVSVAEPLLAAKPSSIGYEEAAAVPMAALTALVGLRDAAELEAGQSVLVTGASGGVGSFAVQLAKVLGAHVTGVCRGRNADVVRKLGADEIVDHTTTDVTRQRGRYDVFFDCAGTQKVAACRRTLTPKGVFVMVGGPAGRWVGPADRMIATKLQAPFAAQRMAVTEVVRNPHQTADLAYLAGLIDEGRVAPLIDRRYPFAELPDAVRYQEQGHSVGKVVVGGQ